jgi:deazaflavin-dependent oxidoreductase (nitroreductase family)
MSLMHRLGYDPVTPQSGWRRGFVKAAAHEPLSSIIARTATPLDRLVLRGSSGGLTATSIMTGFPVLWLTTTGAITKQPRVVPLLGIPTPAGHLAVLGTNFGAEKTPGWVHNVIAHPELIAAWRNNVAHVTAMPVPLQDQEPIWSAAIAAYPNYANYRARAAHRTIRVFELIE